MLPVERVIGESGLTVGEGRARIDVRLPWYRSLPLSTIAIDAVLVDGAAVPLDAIGFSLNGARHSLAALADMTDTFWFVLDSAVLEFRADIRPGASHEVEVALSLFPPYIPGLRRENRQTATLVAEAA